MKVGDLVMLHKGGTMRLGAEKPAIIVEMPWQGSTAMKIMMFDGTKVCALTTNVVLISEAKENTINA